MGDPQTTILSSKLAAFARRHGCVCYWCKNAVLLDVSTTHGLSPSRDHLKPKAHRGTNEASNLVLAHRSCNTRRGTLSPEAFRLLLRDVTEQVGEAGLTPSVPSVRAGSIPVATTQKQWVSMRDFWPEQNLAEIGSRVRRDLAREERRYAQI